MRAYHLLIVAIVSGGCSSTNAPVPLPQMGDSGADAGAPASGDGSATLEDFNATPADFDCSKNNEWTAVGFSHYKNTLGHTAEMLTVAMSGSGGTFPVGTVIQLNPAEAMVKRRRGFDATSADWEFFTLTDSDAGTTTINTRGGGSSVSNARGTCLSCHAMAAPQFDMVCGDDPDGGATTAHGCNPLPVPNSKLATLLDPRCP
jgi:hypothetical protein